MPSAKEQHYVPQFYLRRFGREDRKSIDLIHLRSGRFVSAASIKAQCRKPNFYGPDAITEREALAPLDEMHASAIRRVVTCGEVAQDDPTLRWELLSFLLLQRHRTDAKRLETVELLKALLRHPIDLESALGVSGPLTETSLADWSRGGVPRSNRRSSCLGSADQASRVG
jgi:hypothetical protein